LEEVNTTMQNKNAVTIVAAFISAVGAIVAAIIIVQNQNRPSVEVIVPPTTIDTLIARNQAGRIDRETLTVRVVITRNLDRT